MKLSDEERLEQAIEAYRKGKMPSIRQAALAFEVPYSTLRDRLSKTHQSDKAFKQTQQRLSPAKEETIIRTIEQLAL
jgi:transposase